MSHEKVSTFEFDGQFVNLPTAIGPKGYENPDAAVSKFRRTGKNLGVFESEKLAVAAAKKRSGQFRQMRRRPSGSGVFTDKEIGHGYRRIG